MDTGLGTACNGFRKAESPEFALGENLERVAERLLKAPGRYGFASEDDAADALLKNWKKLAGAMEVAKRDSGNRDKSGEIGPYIDTCLRWLAKTERRDRKRREDRESASGCGEEWGLHETKFEWESESENERECETSSNAMFTRFGKNGLADIPAKCFLASLDTESRRILFLFLKCAGEADDGLAFRVARRTGVPFPWLVAMAERARCHLEPERARIEHLNASANAVWLRMRIAEKRIAEEPDIKRRGEIGAKLARDRQRYERLAGQRARIRLVVPNSVVAKLLAVPKGTVDSGIYYLRASKSLPRDIACG